MSSNNPAFQSVLPEYLVPKRGVGGLRMCNLRSVTVCYAACSHIYKLYVYLQGRPLGGASGALAPGADFEGAPKRRSPTGHTLICSTVA
jgi:hypothetical protein